MTFRNVELSAAVNMQVQNIRKCLRKSYFTFRVWSLSWLEKAIVVDLSVVLRK